MDTASAAGTAVSKTHVTSDSIAQDTTPRSMHLHSLVHSDHSGDSSLVPVMMRFSTPSKALLVTGSSGTGKYCNTLKHFTCSIAKHTS